MLPVQFFLAGRFQRPSIADGDANVQIVNTTDNQAIGTTSLMVRIRKNANSLTTAERNRLLAAFATLNNAGMGRFADFRNVHSSAGDPEAHQNAGFPPWHRAFLLDLERELQQIDPSVALPYWRFDEPAPNLFTRDFMGVTDPSTGRVLFSATNPLQFWATDGVIGIVRRPRFNTQTQRATALQGPVITEPETFLLGLSTTSPPIHRYSRFRRYEGNPHGTAHVSFTGSISQIATAAKDPLFFLLHANVDRLWAKWQWLNRRFDVNDPSSFEPLGAAGSPGTHPGRPQLERHDVAMEPDHDRATAVDGSRRNDGCLAAHRRSRASPYGGVDDRLSGGTDNGQPFRVRLRRRAVRVPVQLTKVGKGWTSQSIAGRWRRRPRQPPGESRHSGRHSGTPVHPGGRAEGH